MPRSAHSPLPTRLARTVLAVVVVLLLGGCSWLFGDEPSEADAASAAEQACRATSGEPGPTVVVLAAGRVPSLDELATTVEETNLGPVELFDRLAGGDTGSGPAGLVVLARPDGAGELVDTDVFDLREFDGNETNATIEARGRAGCLVDAMAALPAAEIPPTTTTTEGQEPDPTSAADLVSAMDDAAARGRSEAGEGPVTILVFGLGRSSFGGRHWADLDLSADQVTGVLDEFTSEDVPVPDIGDEPDLAIRFVAPAEGLQPGVRAGIERLAGELCVRFGVADCDLTQAL